MRAILRVAGRALGAALLLLIALLAFSAFRYSREMAIDPARGVAESGYVRIGGIDQWLQIRGDDRRNPVLLWLNGGPGFSTIPGTHLYRSWERYFTVVMWDQRGEGKTFEKAGATGMGPMTVERMTEDGIEVARYLCDHLHQRRIVVLGHSWGSILGVRMIRQRPELFAAYVGTGQVTNFAADAAASYPLLLARARALGNRSAEEQLTAMGPPPYDRLDKNLTWIIWANELDPGQIRAPLSAGRPWAIVQAVLKQPMVRAGLRYSQETMLRPMLETDLLALGVRFEVPVVMIEGSEDLVTVTALARDYFDRLSAPRKEFVLLKGDGHLALMRDRDAFLAALVDHVRPLAAP